MVGQEAHNATAAAEQEMSATEASLQGAEGVAKTHSKSEHAKVHSIDWWREQAKTKGGARGRGVYKRADSTSLNVKVDKGAAGEGGGMGNRGSLGDGMVSTSHAAGRRLVSA